MRGFFHDDNVDDGTHRRPQDRSAFSRARKSLKFLPAFTCGSLRGISWFHLVSKAAASMSALLDSKCSSMILSSRRDGREAGSDWHRLIN